MTVSTDDPKLTIYEDLEQGSSDWLQARCGIAAGQQATQPQGGDAAGEVTMRSGKPSDKECAEWLTPLAQWVTKKSTASLQKKMNALWNVRAVQRSARIA